MYKIIINAYTCEAKVQSISYYCVAVGGISYFYVSRDTLGMCPRHRFFHFYGVLGWMTVTRRYLKREATCTPQLV
jgi:hypothetical protein